MLRIALSLLCLSTILAAPAADLMTKIPGYPQLYNTSIYSGYLQTGNANRSLHYVFVESVSGANNSDPVTLWLNGGPGCSSLLGFLQQIGPYYLETGKDYKDGDILTRNDFSWHRLSNLLFLESPAGVGYSVNQQQNFTYNDSQVAQDNFKAVIDFLTNKFREYSKNEFWLAGESYAGKYIPDLAVLIDKYNRGNPIVTVQLRGQLVGNGVMTFEDGDIVQSQTNFMINHEFIDPELILYWKKSCPRDSVSAGCRFFRQRFDDNIFELNRYSVYDYCYYNDSFAGNKQGKKRHTQESILNTIIRGTRPTNNSQDFYANLGDLEFNDPECAYWDGVHSYFNNNDQAFHAKYKGQVWQGPCSDDVIRNYNIDLRGSMASYRYLLGEFSTNYKIVFYNGDWDSVVPYIDTVKNLMELNLQESQTLTPWFTDGQHSGFTQLYSGVLFVTVKGASHSVPQSRRATAYQLFKNILTGTAFN